jgi:hypothetical protein
MNVSAWRFSSWGTFIRYSVAVYVTTTLTSPAYLRSIFRWGHAVVEMLFWNELCASWAGINAFYYFSLLIRDEWKAELYFHLY